MLREKMKCVIKNAFYNRNLNIYEIIPIIEMVREVYNIDEIFVATNREYYYQLDETICCDRRGTKNKTGNRIMLTKENYARMTDIFKEYPVYDMEMPIFDNGHLGYVLRGAIMQGNHYYGHVGFCSDLKREWTDEEREIMGELTHLLLLCFGLNYLNGGFDRFNNEKYKFQHKSISSGFFLNLKSGKCHGIKIAPFLKEHGVREWEDYDHLLKEYTNYFVDPIYGQELYLRCAQESLKHTLTLENPNVCIDFPRVVNEKVNWFRFVVELISCDEQGLPEKAYFFFRDITDEMQNKAYISSVSTMEEHVYTIISSIDLDSERYAIYVDNRDANTKDKAFLAFGEYRELIDKMAGEQIDHYYSEKFKEIFSIEHLKRHFNESEDILRYEFPYEYNGKNYWVKLEAVKTQHFLENGKKIVLYFSDITKEKKNELKLKAVSLNLEKEHERALEAELQVMTDPLTGTYNRAGFEKSLKEYADEKIPVGFVLIDVDKFKTINDTYGHKFGDEVLVKVAKRLQNSFRNEDKVFRLGGDEFALLLYGCTSEAWGSLESKFAAIHQYLREVIDKDINVTLSVGFVQSDAGYQDGLMSLADEAMYHTKSEGRAGMTQIGLNHEVLHSWHDSELRDRVNAMQEAVAVGKWRIDWENNSGQKPQMFFDETSHIMFGIPNTLTPLESYEFWFSRIVERHRELYFEMKERLFAMGQAECTYHWMHPSKGECSVRVTAKYIDSGDNKEIVGVMRVLGSEDVVLSYDDAQFLMKAMNRIYFCTYYFSLYSKHYYIIQGHEDEKDVKERHENIDITFKEFVENFVHPDYRQQVAEFSDLETLSDRLQGKTHIDCDYLSVSSMGWCRTRIMPVKWDENGNLTHAVSMSACINDDKMKEIAKEEAAKEAMKMQIQIAETISKTTIIQKAIINKKSGETKVWAYAGEEEKQLLCQFDEMKQWGRQFVYEKDLPLFEESFSLDVIKDSIDRKGKFSLTFRRQNKDNTLATFHQHFVTLQTDASKILMIIENVSEYVPEGIAFMQQFDILEKVNEAIAIYDYETYDILYMNEMARDLSGMTTHEYRKKKCYDVFGEHGKPCHFCDNVVLDDGGNGIMIREILGTGKSYLLHGSVMEINGKKYRVEQAVPSSDIDASIEHLQGLLVTEQKLMSCVQHLIQISDVEDAIAYLLDQIILFYGCNRACLSKLIGNHQGVIVTERCNIGETQKFYSGQVLTLTDFMQWDTVYSPIKLRKVFCAGDESEEQRWMREEGIDNLMILSFEYGNGQIGYISIDGVQKNKDNTNWIGTLAFFIANEMQKMD